MKFERLRIEEHDRASSLVSRRFFWCLVAVALAASLLVRLPLMAPPGFPMGEGGLFVRFAEQILSDNFILPRQVMYGGVTLPFAYPPAAFYLAAGLARLTGANLLDIFYWLPILLNLAAIPAFCLLASEITRDRRITAAAAILYALMPQSFIWQVTGGGLPRSLAALMAILAICCAFRAVAMRQALFAIVAGCLTGLAILSHLEWGILAASGVSLAMLCRAGFRKGVAMTALAGSVALAAVTPWLLTVVARDGFQPFLSGASGSQWNPAQFLVELLTGTFFLLLLWPAVIGVFRCFRHRDHFLLLWTPAILLLTPRMAAASGIAIPTAMLAGVGLAVVADRVTGRMLKDATIDGDRRDQLVLRHPWGIGTPMLMLLAAVALLLISPLRNVGTELAVVRPLDRDTREAMQWISRNTDPGAKFIVVSGSRSWWSDSVAEWFPYLADRASVTTAQGLEWAGPGVFAKKVAEVESLKAIQGADSRVLPLVVPTLFCGADAVALFLPPEDPTRSAFFASDRFEPRYSGEGAAVFAMKPAATC